MQMGIIKRLVEEDRFGRPPPAGYRRSGWVGWSGMLDGQSSADLCQTCLEGWQGSYRAAGLLNSFLGDLLHPWYVAI